MTQAINALLVGADGQTAATTTNPLPVELASGSVNVTAMISGSVTLAASTASIGSTTVIGSLPAGTNAIGNINFNPGAAKLTSGIINFSAIGTSLTQTGPVS